MDWFIINTGMMLIFGLKHSLLTTKGMVNIYNKFMPTQLWNISYSVLSVVVLLLIFTFWQRSPVVIYQTQGFLSYFIAGLGFFCVFMFLFCFKYTTSFAQWLGVSQLWRTIFRREQKPYYRVRRNGLKKYVRFPHHTFLTLLFWCQPNMTLDTLWMAIFATIYTYIGTVHQDSRGKRLLGEDWIQYSMNTTLMVPSPRLIFKNYTEKKKAAKI